jgi:signal transduction histidine kinase
MEEKPLSGYAGILAWLRARPPLAADGLVALGLLLAALPGVPRPWDHTPELPGTTRLALCGLALAQTLPHLWRRRWPLGVVAVTIAVFLVRSATFTGQWAGWSALPAAAISVSAAFWAVASFGDRRTQLVGAAVAVAVAVASWSQIDRWVGLLAGSVAFAVAVPVTAIRAQQRADAAALAARAERLEAERRQALAAAGEERVRIARELHDVVAHHVSVMVVQAEAAQCVLASEPGEADAAVRAVTGVGREALAELRRLLGVLRADGEETERPEPMEGGGTAAPRMPRPSLVRLGGLVGQVRAAGLPVELAIEGEPRPLPAGLDLSAYRIVQEALTNALRHGGRASTRILVRYGDDALEVEVVNDSQPAPAPGAEQSSGEGYGLVGMRERVAVFGGDLAAGPRPEGGFAVRVRLPLSLGTA